MSGRLLRWTAPVALAVACVFAAPPLAAQPQTLKDRVKWNIEVGVTWLRTQIDGEGTFRNDAYLTAQVVRVFAENFRKYAEDDGPYMWRPIGFVRERLAGKPAPIVSAAGVLALSPLNNPKNQPLIEEHGAVARRWIAESASIGRPVDIEQVGLAVAAARAAGTPPGGDLLQQTLTLVERGTMDGPIPGFRDALRLHAVLAAGAPGAHPVVRDSVANIGEVWGWWADAARRENAGYAVVPARFWQALVRALVAYGKPTIEDADGKPHDWKAEVGGAILDAQHADGYWVEQHDKIGDTVAAVTALELIYKQQ